MKALFLAVTAVLSLAGCGHIANLGIDPARLDTANRQLAAYAGEITALADLGTDLVERGVISPDQGLRVADHLENALDLATAAQAQLAETGDPQAAERTIEQIARSIDLALGLLTAFAPMETADLKPPKVRLSFSY